MRTKISLFIIVIILISSQSCDEFEIFPLGSGYVTDIQLDKKNYYSEEIFEDQYLDFYDKWYLYLIWGGFGDQSWEKDFDLLSIEKFGIYKMYRNDSLMVYGKIRVLNQDDETLLVHLVPDSILVKFVYSELFAFVYLTDSTMVLREPGNDMLSFHFTN